MLNSACLWRFDLSIRLMKAVSTALSSLGIDYCSCTGTMAMRNKCIQEFKRGNSPILILSWEESVSGLNLTEASHVVIFHPFLVEGYGKQMDGDKFDEDTRMAISFEKQGILRAWRFGQTKKVEVVRFLTRDSIEDELATQRGYSEGEFDNLNDD
jgi:SNF2 family DNA or RNA helicase